MKVAFTLLAAMTGVGAHAQLNQAGLGGSTGATVPVIARVDAALTGIRGVTYTNLTQSTMSQAQSFFAAGGVDLRPAGATLPAGTGGQLVPVRPAIITASSDPELKSLLDARAQLQKEDARLAGVIAARARARQASAAEGGERAWIATALSQLDRRITVRWAALQKGGAATAAAATPLARQTR